MARPAAAIGVRIGYFRVAAGRTRATAHSSSKMPMPIHVPRENAWFEGTCCEMLSHMNTFMLPPIT